MLAVTGDDLKRIRMMATPPLNQAEFARIVGVSRSLVSMMESQTSPVSPQVESSIRAKFPREVAAANQVVQKVVAEGRAGYAQTQDAVVEFLIDFISDPDASDLKSRARALLKQII